MEVKIPFHKPSVGTCEINAVGDVILSGHLTTGNKTKEFESQFAKYVGSKYAVFLSSCTSALKLAIQYKNMDFKDGDNIIVPSFTYAATVNEIVLAGLNPVFCDIEDSTLCIDYNEVNYLKSKIKSPLLIEVDFAGNLPSEVKVADKIIDSAHRIVRNGFSGYTECYSFYPTKNMTTGEGGMICTDSRDEYEWYLKARHHGKSRPIGYGYDIEFIGSKYNNTDMAAAIGLEQLQKLDYFNKRRNEIRDMYNLAFGTNWKGNHLYIYRTDNRDDFIRHMETNGIGVSVHFKPIHTMSAYKDFKLERPLTVTESIQDKIVSLPLYPSLDDEEVKYIIEKVKSFNSP